VDVGAPGTLVTVAVPVGVTVTVAVTATVGVIVTVGVSVGVGTGMVGVGVIVTTSAGTAAVTRGRAPPIRAKAMPPMSVRVPSNANAAPPRRVAV